MPVKIEMDMPKCCAECRFQLSDNRYGEMYCAITSSDADYECERPINCPLKEIK